MDEVSITSPTPDGLAAAPSTDGVDGQSTTTGSSFDPMQCELYNFVVCFVVIGIVCVSGLVGNVLSFLVLWKHKPETAAIFLLQCLAVIDFLLLVLTLFIYTLPAVFPYTGQLSVFHDSFDTVKINYIWPVGMMLHTATIWLTVLVTVNRYNAVCRAIQEFGATNLRSTKIQVGVVIVFSIAYNVPRFFEHTEIGSTSPINRTVDIRNSSGDGSSDAPMIDPTVTVEESDIKILGDDQIYQIIYSNLLYYPVMYILPLGSLGYLNFKLIMALNAIKQKAIASGRRRKEDNITHCVIAIVCVFIVSQTPALLNQIFWATFSFDDRDCGKFHFYYTKISDLLVVVNSSCNFVVYILFGKTFRQIFLDTVCCRNSVKVTTDAELTVKARYTQVHDNHQNNV